MINFIFCLIDGHEWVIIKKSQNKDIRRRCVKCGLKQWWDSEWEEWKHWYFG